MPQRQTEACFPDDQSHYLQSSLTAAAAVAAGTRGPGWCRDSRGGDRRMTLGCILKVNLIGLPEELLREVGARRAAVHRVTKSQTQLK